MLDLVFLYNLLRHLRSKIKVLEAIDENDDDVDENTFKLWNRWVLSDVKLRKIIRNNYKKSKP